MASGPSDLSKIAGSSAMAKPGASSNATTPANGAANASSIEAPAAKPKRKHRGGKKHKRNRRQSFAAPSEATETAGEDEIPAERPSLLDVPDPRSSAQQASLYRLRNGNRSNTSLDSDVLHDHRDHDVPRSRRKSISQSFSRPGASFQRPRHFDAHTVVESTGSARIRPNRGVNPNGADDGDNDGEVTDRTPLLGSQQGNRSRPDVARSGSHHKARRQSTESRTSRFRPESQRQDDEDYDVNNPPSMPGSPKLGSLDDLMINDLSRSDPTRERDVLIDIDEEDDDDEQNRDWELPSGSPMRRRATVADMAERDVCFPLDDGLTDVDEMEGHHSRASSRPARRRRSRRWPDIGILEDWSMQEKEERTVQDLLRVKKISEPIVVGGRLRPKKAVWHPEEDDAPFRFTYFNETLDSTIHARTISDLCQAGSTFRDLFLPDPIELSDDSDSDDDDTEDNALERPAHPHPHRAPSIAPSETNTLSKHALNNNKDNKDNTAVKSPPGSKAPTGTSTPDMLREALSTPKPGARPKRYGPRPTFWLDVMKPTEMEMKVISKAFGIHQLTTEDILTNEEREKVELFQSYYFVNYRSFEQDKSNSEYMEPVNIYAVVFREGVLTFHHSMTPHGANVRRRIRQLNDYMSPTADWICYALIDDISDTYAPLVQQIEEEVDDIDDEILYMHQRSNEGAGEKSKNRSSNRPVNGNTQADAGAAKAEGDRTANEQGQEILARVGECRKRVMGLYRLLGNKADVIKGFAKRCNEQWEVAPRSEIGLYLGDIFDHIATMSGNLSHYEK